MKSTEAQHIVNQLREAGQWEDREGDSCCIANKLFIAANIVEQIAKILEEAENKEFRKLHGMDIKWNS